MDRQHINQLLRTLGTVLAFSLVIFLLSRQGWEEIMAGIRAISPVRLVVCFSLMLLSRAAVAFRWHILLRSGGVPIRLRDSFRIAFAGLFSSNFLPTTIGGDVVRLAMAVRSGYDSVIITASLAVDRLVGMAGMASAAPLGLPPVLSLTRSAQAAGILAGLFDRLKGVFLRLVEAVRMWLKSPRGLFLAFAWTWIHQSCLFAVVWLLLDSLGDPMPFWLVAGLWSFTYFVTLLPISINGLGLQELSMTAIFSTLGGVSVSNAAMAALLFRTLQMLASVPGAAFLSDIFAGSPLNQKGGGHAD